jgi:hypothetical protein
MSAKKARQLRREKQMQKDSEEKADIAHVQAVESILKAASGNTVEPERRSTLALYPMGEGLFDATLNHHIRSVPTPSPTKGDNGKEVEDEIHQLFSQNGEYKELVFKGLLYTPPKGSQIEISDGIVTYGDTAFIIQSKSRQDQAVLSAKEELSKFEKRKAKAWDQVEESLLHMQKAGGLEFTNLAGDSSFLKIEDYNWVGLIIINYNESPFGYGSISPTVSNPPEFNVPRVAISLNDLERIMKLDLDAGQVLNYLRRLQYEPYHVFGSELERFWKFNKAGIYPPKNVPSILSLTDLIINATADQTRATSDLSYRGFYRELHKGLDTLTANQLEILQKNFLRNLTHKRTYIHQEHIISDYRSRIVYSILYVDSSIHPIEDANAEAQMLALSLYVRYWPKVRASFSVVVDTSNYVKWPHYIGAAYYAIFRDDGQEGFAGYEKSKFEVERLRAILSQIMDSSFLRFKDEGIPEEYKEEIERRRRVYQQGDPNEKLRLAENKAKRHEAAE